MTILRYILNAGHGLNNKSVGTFDPGAQSSYGGEHAIVSQIVFECVRRFWSNPKAEYSVTDTPACSDHCVAKHPRLRAVRSGVLVRAGHLSFLPRYINDNLIRTVDGQSPDVLISLHLDWFPDAKVTGVTVLYSDQKPQDREGAVLLAETVSSVLGLKNRGAKPDSAAKVGSVGLLDKVRCPAYLIELGYVTNPNDVKAVKERGVDAVIAGMEALRKPRGFGR